jgi:hypothetical protein
VRASGDIDGIYADSGEGSASAVAVHNDDELGFEQFQQWIVFGRGHDNDDDEHDEAEPR